MDFSVAPNSVVMHVLPSTLDKIKVMRAEAERRPIDPYAVGARMYMHKVGVCLGWRELLLRVCICVPGCLMGATWPSGGTHPTQI